MKLTTVPVTIDTLTDEMIDDLRNEALDVDDVRLANVCDVAIDPSTPRWQRDRERAKIVAHLNAVAAMEVK